MSRVLSARLHLHREVVEIDLARSEVRLLEGPDATSVVATLTGIGSAVGRDRRDRIVLAGRHLTRRSTAGRVRAGLGMVVGAPVAPEVSIVDHLAAIVGPARAPGLLRGVPHLQDRGGDPAGVLSGGERVVLSWVRCAAGSPRVVVLDGAGAGLDRAALAWAGQVVDRWREDGVAVLVRPGRPEERAWAA